MASDSVGGALDRLSASLGWRLRHGNANATLEDAIESPFDAGERQLQGAKVLLLPDEPMPTMSAAVPFERRTYRDKNGERFYLALSLNEDLPDWGEGEYRRGINTQDQVAGHERFLLGSGTPALRYEPAATQVAPVATAAAPTIAVRCMVRSGVSAPRKGNRLNFVGVVDHAMRAISSALLSLSEDGPSSRRFVGTTMEQHGFCIGISTPTARRRAIILALRFCPPSTHDDYGGGCVVVISMDFIESESSGAVQERGAFVVKCSCDQDVEIRVGGASSLCAHAQEIVHRLRSGEGGSFLSSNGRRVRNFLALETARAEQSARKGKPGADACDVVSDRSRDARVVGDLAWRKSKKSKQSVFLIIVQRRLFACPVLARVFSTRAGTVSSRLECQRCQAEQSTRGTCEHESAASTCSRPAIGAERQRLQNLAAVSRNDLHARDVSSPELNLAGVLGDSDNSVAAGAGPVRSEDRFEFFGDEDDTSENGDDVDTPEVRFSSRPWISKLPRSPFPCLSQVIIMEDRAIELRHHDLNSKNAPLLGEFVDVDGKCHACDYVSNDCRLEMAACTRAMVLQNLATSPAIVHVRDWRCPRCLEDVHFDGASLGVFASSKRYLWCRGLLDSLVAGPLRFASTGRATAGQHAYFTRAAFGPPHPTGAHIRGNPDLVAGQRQQREACAHYIAVLGDAPRRPGSFAAFFRCFTGCEMANGILRGLVLDGNALGIKANLVPCNFPVVTIPPLASAQNAKQYMLRRRDEREALRYLCRQAQAGEGGIMENAENAEWGDDESRGGLEINLHELCGAGAKRRTKEARAEASLRLFHVGGRSAEEEEDAEECMVDFLDDLTACSPDGLSGEQASPADPFGEGGGTGFNTLLNLDDREFSHCCTISVCSVLRVIFSPVFEKTEAMEAGVSGAQAVGEDDPFSWSSTSWRCDGENDGGTDPTAIFPALRRNAVRRAAYAVLLSLVADPPLALLLEDGRLEEIERLGDTMVKLSCCGHAELSRKVMDVARTLEPDLILPVATLIRGLAVTLAESDGQGGIDFDHISEMLLSFGRLFILCSAVCKRFTSCVYPQHRSQEAENFEVEYAKRLKRREPMEGRLEGTMEEAQRTGHFYPGRPAMCPAVSFTAPLGHGRAAALCSKEYPHPFTTSAGLIMGACTCSHPVVPGFSIMPTSETLGMVWTVMLCFFFGTPLLVYDAGCNLWVSVASRMMWSLERLRVIMDNFHALGHVCGPGFRAIAARFASTARTSGVESLNGAMKLASVSLMYTRASNYVPFVGVRLMFLNLGSRWRYETGQQDADSADLTALGNRVMPCGCALCETGRVESETFRDLETTFKSEATFLTKTSRASRATVLADYYRDRQRSLTVLYDTRTGLKLQC